MKLNKADLVGGIIVLGVGVFFGVGSLFNDKLTFRAQTSDGVPGAGFFPIIFGFILVTLAILLITRSIGFGSEGEYTLEKSGSPDVLDNAEVEFSVDSMHAETPEEQKLNNKILAATVGIILMIIVAWQLTGQFFPVLFFAVVVQGRLYKRGWISCVVFSAILTLALYAAFEIAFKIQFVL